MKKAYAGIMLNMAQESAARVLAAERRAAALAAGLEAAKEDGVAALLRLKATMEARIKEKELETSVHVKKIKELEEQLHGSQNAMASLKVELQRANTELDLTRKTLADERINSLPTSNNVYSNKNASPRSKMHQKGVSLKNKKAADNSDDTCLVPINKEENEAVENLEDMDRRSPDLPSLMERNKKPKFYHNGCTQRIHALKQQTQSTDAFLKQNQKQATALNSRSKARKNNADKNPCHTRSIMEQILQTKFLGKFKRKRGRRSRPSYKHDNSSEHEEAEYKFSDRSESDGNGCLLLLKAFEDLSPPKMSAEHDGEAFTDQKEDLKMNRRDAELSRCTALPELIDVLAVNSVQMKRRKRTKTVRVLEDDFSETKSVPEPANTQLRTSEKSMSGNQLISEMTENRSDTPTRNSGPFLKCATANLMHQTDAGNGQFDPEITSSVFLQSTKSETTDYGNLVVDEQELITLNNNTASLKEVNEDGSCSLASPKTDALTLSSLDKENLKASSGLPGQTLEKHDISVGSSLNKKEHTKASSGASMQAEGARHIKYTFNRRKRKGMSIDSTPQRAVPLESSDLCSPTNKQKLHPDHVEQDHLIDSPQGDSQLAQVAEQLILLSEHV
ncbi:hypothetical protein BDA96_04G205200 [Sorghum bicolor]|nr:hypothetical protein BDA96_04G205200 [Sorghum bicolor]